MRGEDSSLLLKAPLIRETPPHAWGRRSTRKQRTRICGNTPTCVGKTVQRLAPFALSRKHPHMRGEDQGQSAERSSVQETPPHAWGRLGTRKQRTHGCGNTPTCVGKTTSNARIVKGAEKHPHMRGEDSTDMAVRRLASETPPHAWGRLDDTIACCARVRNTPTCVGKTCAIRWPCACRETPPHAWGRLGTRKQRTTYVGNTPTCVGKTRSLP